ncbi:hypothetical protein [Lutibacter sp.]|uniref:hypothetical protein n=1 Tax=Lutibacter sp. TaxID=1925666 RepID=UPI00356179C2
MVKNKIYFCSFADSRLQPTLNRIINEAKESNFFDGVFAFNEFTLNKDFKKKFKNVLKYSVRGFGYWIWKVSIIQDVLKKMNDGDILLYADSGCSINKAGLKRFGEYVELVKNCDLGILAVELQESMLERKYTKGDLFDFLNVRDDALIYNSPQVQAGLIMIRKNKKSLKFFKQWQQVFESNYSLINDDLSKSENFKDFIVHRHDQSIFSILFKINKGVTIPLSEVWIEDKNKIGNLKNSPLLYLRLKNEKIQGVKYILINWIRNLLKLNGKINK